MIQFVKGDNTEAPYLLDAGTSLLPSEGDGAVISAIESVTRVSGDVVLGTLGRAPAIVDSGTGILIWVSGGTSGTSTIFEIVFTLSTGVKFDIRIKFIVSNSTF